MSHDEQDGVTEVAEPAEPVETDGSAGPDEPSEDADAAPSRRRDHPVFESLTGFYTGLVFLVVVPGGLTALLATLLGYRRAEPLFPFVLLALVVPIALLVPERTRRFARYMLLGVALTAAVILIVGALVLWLLIALDG